MTALSIRINLANGGKLGPGKVALLKAIDSEGSIRKAAASLSMSYPRALKLIDELNRDFTAPVIESVHGGAERGGSHLTSTGADVLKLYNQAVEAAASSTGPALEALAALTASN